MQHLLARAVLMCIIASLAACGARLGGEEKEKPVAQTVSLERPNTPDARAVQVSWTAARASFCAFGMNKEKLRGDYLAYERAQGATPQQMARLERMYDVTYKTFYARVQAIPKYCSRKRIEEIRPDINRHLRGDYTPSKRKAPKENIDDGRYIPVERKDMDPGLHAEDDPLNRKKN